MIKRYRLCSFKICSNINCFLRPPTIFFIDQFGAFGIGDVSVLTSHVVSKGQRSFVADRQTDRLTDLALTTIVTRVVQNHHHLLYIDQLGADLGTSVL